MLTPQEVANNKLERALLGGYVIASVDQFLEQVTQDYTALYRENGILKTKMKVLVDKVEDYRSTEDAMRMALLQAEQTAKEMIAAAEARRDSIEAEAAQKRGELMRQLEADAEERRSELRQSLAAEEAALDNAKRATAEYLDRLKGAMASYADTLARVYDFVEPLPPRPEGENEAEAEAEPAPAEADPAPPEETPQEGGVSQDTADVIAEIIHKTIDSMEKDEQPAREQDKKDFTVTTLPDIDFKNLQFGDKYKLK